jgi:predicted nucleotide-binding protein (sugar kinase/HSP70/actin superfamily)
LLRELNYEPVIADRPTPAMLPQFAARLPADFCLPVKLAAAQAKQLLASGKADSIFIPSLLECAPRCEGDSTHTCFVTQHLPDMLRSELGEKLISTQFCLGKDNWALVEPVLELARALQRPIAEVTRALRKAVAAQEEFGEARRLLGDAALLAPLDRAVVVLGRPYNTHEPLLNLSLGRHLRRLGLAAIPWDLLPLNDVRLDERWETLPWHYGREQVRAAELIRRHSQLFPLVISSYGCGPDAFTTKHLEVLLRDRPRLFLEFDEHRGEAGMVTRLEAFADQIEESLRAGCRVARPGMTPGRKPLPATRRFFIPDIGPHARIYAQALRGAGEQAEVLPEADDEAVRVGLRQVSGRECHPYAVVCGELLRFARTSVPGDVFLVPSCTAPCLLRQYGDGLRILLQEQGLTQPEVWEANASQLGDLLGVGGLLNLYQGLFCTDVILTLGTRLRPYESSRGAIDRLLQTGMEEVASVVGAKRDLRALLAQQVELLWRSPRSGAPGTRPVVGVTGDLYTRVNSTGNADLFRRLEEMGCEVWPSPFFALMMDLSATAEAVRALERGRFVDAALDKISPASPRISAGC